MRSTGNIKKLIKNLKLDVYTNSESDKSILNELLRMQDSSQEPAFTSQKIRRQEMTDRSRAWKIAAVLAIVIGGGALATTVGLKVRKLYLIRREPDGSYMFATKPETADEPMRMVSSRLDPNQTVEQKIKDLEEVDLLRQQDTNRELLGVVETEVNGQAQPRSFSFKYTLSDGREIKIHEGDPDTQNRERTLTEAQEDELIDLLRADKYEKIDGKEEDVRGRVFVFSRQRFILDDGTEVIKSVGRPKKEQ